MFYDVNIACYHYLRAASSPPPPLPPPQAAVAARSLHHYLHHSLPISALPAPLLPVPQPHPSSVQSLSLLRATPLPYSTNPVRTSLPSPSINARAFSLSVSTTSFPPLIISPRHPAITRPASPIFGTKTVRIPPRRPPVDDSISHSPSPTTPHFSRPRSLDPRVPRPVPPNSSLLSKLPSLHRVAWNRQDSPDPSISRSQYLPESAARYHHNFPSRLPFFSTPRHSRNASQSASPSRWFAASPIFPPIGSQTCFPFCVRSLTLRPTECPWTVRLLQTVIDRRISVPSSLPSPGFTTPTAADLLEIPRGIEPPVVPDLFSS